MRESTSDRFSSPSSSINVERSVSPYRSERFGVSVCAARCCRAGELGYSEPPGIACANLRTATPDPRGHRRLLTDVRTSLCLVVESDNMHDFATPDGQHLKPKGRSTTLPGILCTSHAHADEESIIEDLHVIRAPPHTSISTSLIPGQHLHQGHSAERFSEFHPGLDHLEFLLDRREDLNEWAAKLTRLESRTRE
jgi:hypothetical protein